MYPILARLHRDGVRLARGLRFLVGLAWDGVRRLAQSAGATLLEPVRRGTASRDSGAAKPSLA